MKNNEFKRMQELAGIKKLNENQISRDVENLVNEKGWDSYEDIEAEIEKIRDEFNLVDSKSRYDEAYSKFEEIYHVNPIDLKKYFQLK
jgi:hypothetical protein